jgi:hypothetical protein
MNFIRAQAINFIQIVVISAMLVISPKPSMAETTRIEMISTLDFVAEVLEMVKLNLIPSQTRNLTLIFQPWVKNNPGNIDRRTDFILLQEGIQNDKIIEDFAATGQKIDLVWVLLVKKRLYEQLNGARLDLLSFSHALQSDFCKNNYKYPWFESLYSKNTLLNFIKVLGEAKKSGINKNKTFARQDGAIKILYRAIEDGILNPLSLEASQQLALNVFRANDSVCCTLWVPYDLLVADDQAYHSIAGDFKVLAFPRAEGKAVIPKISFSLWKRKNTRAALRIKVVEKTHKKSDWEFIEPDIFKDAQWIEAKFAQTYDRLIMGDF